MPSTLAHPQDSVIMETGGVEVVKLVLLFSAGRYTIDVRDQPASTI